MLKSRPLASVDLTADPIELAKEMRKSFSFSDITPKAKQCSIEGQTFEFGGHKTEGFWVNWNGSTTTAAGSKDQKFILYLHGGGYMVGDIEAYGGYECYISKGGIRQGCLARHLNA
ncbi:unnamed protein product [Didymodactylos carnosus]|uniref:Alpha/beta hydrolase fold-3 domain-containing protein n=1 Tax=Didymodactylos carnosus TaxID=1234261 RepID=A0A814P5C1_9BILA|nr:unnamed protein product [Didymodactylos carnosus]CAF1156658.1 unnamed protein product [Didymodactylos carnosus]CAF3866291.1 unnamed protein product [Didymodactylos carnosus]CAF3968100.1 unnamed protein product [Didymodactylos carnosus]